MAIRPPQLIGESPLFHALLDRVSDLAALDRPVLLTGARGTGKELIAARLHFLSPRWEQAYIRINCAALTEEALDEALYGRERFDGRPDISGAFAGANEGTLFLDNIEALPLRLQEKLTYILDHNEFTPLESDEEQSANIRVIFAARADLRAAAENGEFSADLLDRIAFEALHLPPLTARPDDILVLAQYFGRKMASSLGADQFPGLTPEALAFLMEQPWPGNVRQLRNVVERSVANAFLADEALSNPIHAIRMDPLGRREPASEQIPQSVTVSAKDPSQNVPPALETTDFAARVMTFERGLIDQALSLHDHHQGKASEYLGLSYHAFRGLLRKHGLKK